MHYTPLDSPGTGSSQKILQPEILADNRPSRVAGLTTNPAEPTISLDSGVEIRLFGSAQECEARAWLLLFATPQSLLQILG